MKHKKGVTYFPTFEEARDAAKSAGWMTGRILSYGLGWAVQREKSGSYLDLSPRKDEYEENPGVREINRHVNDFDSARRFLGSKNERKLANNTIVAWLTKPFQDGGSEIGVRLHGTWIVRYYEDGRIQLSSGGYRTATTKQRINQLLPAGVGVSQHKYEWLLRTWGTLQGENEIPFVDGMTLYFDKRSGALGGVGSKVSAGDRNDTHRSRRNPPRRDGFMEEQVFQSPGWVMETDDGETHAYPGGDVDLKEIASIRHAIDSGVDAVSSYGRIVSIGRVPASTWWGRYSAPGYLDATDWVWGETKREVVDELRRLHGDED